MWADIVITEKIIRFLKSNFKSLGFYEVYKDLPTREECCAIESKVFDELNQDDEDCWSNIFITMKHYFVLDKYVLRTAKKRSLVWQLRWLQISILRSIFLLADVLKILFINDKTFYCSRKTTGNPYSKFVTFIYSNNVFRLDAINFENDF